MSEFQPLIDQLDREAVLRAQALGLQGRFTEGMEMSDENLEIAKSLGEEEMLRRYRIVRALDEQGCYGPPSPHV